MIKIQSLTKSFNNVKILENIHMEIDKGSIYGLLGSNGAGKTTLFKLLTRIYKPDEGTCYIDGKPFEESVHLKDIYYVQEDIYMVHSQTLLERFNEERLYYPNSSEKVFNKLVDFFGLKTNQKLSYYSKGQNKQGAFVLAMASQASILLLDEILDGIDAVVRKKFWKVLLSEVIDRQLTVVISSHALSELDTICDKFGILHDTHLIKEERMDQFKEEVKRIQFAAKGAFVPESTVDYSILKHWKVGLVSYVNIKGNLEAFKADLESQHEVLMFEVLDLNLEEIFISELGGVNYGNENY